MTTEAAAAPDAGADVDVVDTQQHDAPDAGEAKGGDWRGLMQSLYQDDDEGDVNDSKPDAKPDAAAAPAKTSAETPAKPAAPAPSTRFQVLDAEGKPAAATLPEGATIKFKASGRDVVAKSLDEVVQLAQKGVDYDRKASEFGQQRATLERNLAEREQALVTAEETLLAVLFDEEVAGRLREAAERYRDPEVRKGLAAQQQLAQREREDEERVTQQRTQAAESFWNHAADEFTSQLEEFEFLRADDQAEAVELFYNRYLGNRETLFVNAKNAGHDVTDPRVVQAIEQEAGAYLDQAKLLDVMNELNARYEARLGPIAGQSKEQEEIADAEKHNRITAERLRDRNGRRTLHGGGGTAPAPVTTTPRSSGERTFDGAVTEIRGLFDSMRT